MSKFNNTAVRPRNGQGFITSESTPSTLTAEGSVGFRRDAKSELFLAVVSDFAGESSFYETASNRTNRINGLVHEVAVQDPEWVTQLVKWLRNEANMRSISIVVAMEAAKALIDAKIPGGRKIVANAISRGDEPGEALGYWISKHGKRIPSAVKRGIADSVVESYNEFTLARYDTASKGFRFADVIQLTHPTPSDPKQSALFQHAMERRRNATIEAPESLTMLQNRQRLLSLGREELRTLIKGANGSAELKAAGLTWEAVAGSAGLDAEIYESLIPTMGYMALLRNLRKFEEKGVSSAVLDTVANRISDPEQVARSRQLPFRFLAAHRAVSGYSQDAWGNTTKGAGSLRFAYPLEKALNASLKNVPALKGKTLILVDRSGSMFGRPSEHTQLNFADTAAIFGSALAVRAEDAKLVQFGTSNKVVPFNKSSSVLSLVDSFENMGLTETADAVRDNFDKSITRVIIITDEQASGRYTRLDPTTLVPDNIPVYTWNLKGYEASHGASGINRYYFGGLSDQSFKLIPFIEAGVSAKWPWED